METCYRHPDRETGVSCSNCGRPICPDCMTPTSVGMRCPECAKQKTKVVTARGLERDPVLTYGLIAVNVLLTLGQLLSGGGAARGGGGQLLASGQLTLFDVADGDWWRLVTSGFLHAGFFHLLMNMFGLWILGQMLEPALGRLRFAAVYLFSLLAGSFGVLVLAAANIQTGPTVGASGAIFGLFGAAFVLMRERGINPMESGLGAILILNLAITFFPGFNISIGGHVGGLIGGVIAASLLGLIDRRRLPRMVSPAIVGVLALALLGGSIALAGSAV